MQEIINGLLANHILRVSVWKLACGSNSQGSVNILMYGKLDMKINRFRWYA